MTREVHTVTGAFGYSGRFIADRLLAAGHRVRTLTNRVPPRKTDGEPIEVHPLSFDAEDLSRSLAGTNVLYNTYWVRFNHRAFRFADAIANTEALFSTARAVGVERIVHVSITNPSRDSDLEYFRGKAHLEEALRGSGVSHSILRPAVLFGRDDILINNIAWALRRLPVFGVFGDGRYRLQPIHVEDFADLAVEHGAQEGDHTVDAIGPETFEYRELVDTIGVIIGKPRPVIQVPPALGWAVSALLGVALGDVVLTRSEIAGLMEERLYVDAPPAGHTALTAWAVRNRDRLGRRYANELSRRSVT